MSQDSRDGAVVFVFLVGLFLATVLVYQGVQVFREQWFPGKCTCEMIKNHECLPK